MHLLYLQKKTSKSINPLKALLLFRIYQVFLPKSICHSPVEFSYNHVFREYFSGILIPTVLKSVQNNFTYIQGLQWWPVKLCNAFFTHSGHSKNIFLKIHNREIFHIRCLVLTSGLYFTQNCKEWTFNHPPLSHQLSFSQNSFCHIIFC